MSFVQALTVAIGICGKEGVAACGVRLRCICPPGRKIVKLLPQHSASHSNTTTWQIWHFCVEMLAILADRFFMISSIVNVKWQCWSSSGTGNVICFRVLSLCRLTSNLLGYFQQLKKALPKSHAIDLPFYLSFSSFFNHGHWYHASPCYASFWKQSQGKIRRSCGYEWSHNYGACCECTYSQADEYNQSNSENAHIQRKQLAR